jgi:hypothetical protein
LFEEVSQFTPLSRLYFICLSSFIIWWRFIVCNQTWVVYAIYFTICCVFCRSHFRETAFISHLFTTSTGVITIKLLCMLVSSVRHWN